MSEGPEALEVLDSIGEAVVRMDRAGRITRMSRRAEALTGTSTADARGRPLSEVVRIVSAADKAPLDDLTARALGGEIAARAPEDRAVIVARDGAECAVADSAAPLRDSSGAVEGALLVLRDVTAERTAEEESARLQAQLVFSERMASMGTLSGGLAHEINNPLSSVLANLALLGQELPKLLPDTDLTRELIEAVAEAHRGADRVGQIVRGLKVFSSGLDERRQPLDIAVVAERVLHLLANELRHRARVVREFHPAPPVEASEAHLGQVLVNLILNAAQSITEGDADRNEVRVSVRPSPPGEVILEVRDSGAGMSREVLARVFDPFFTTRPVGSGSGLGLSICHGIVTSLGGRIEAESTPGAGTSFRVTLPAAQAVSHPAPASAANARRGRILLVEDDPLVARAVKRTLAREHDVVFVEGGREALQALAKEPFDLIISDLMMPEMTGMELHAELLRTHPDTAARMVFLSGGAFTGAAREFLHRVPNRHIEKPFDPQQLRDLIRQLLSP
jgi:PAS domain S-box-containing protein